MSQNPPFHASRNTPTDKELEMCARFFDIEYYRAVTRRSDLSDRLGLRHYIQEGWRHGFDPSIHFSTNRYLENNPDVAGKDHNPLLHYVRHGRFEGREFQPVEDNYKGNIEQLDQRRIRGWAINEQKPAQLVPLKILVDGLLYAKTHNDKSRGDLLARGLSEGEGGFEIGIPWEKLEPGQHTLEVEFPNGKKIAEVFKIDGSVRSPEVGPLQALPAAQADSLKVVVPIYNAFDDLKICINRLRRHTPDDVQVILINDCSTDPRVKQLLGVLSDEERFSVTNNDLNMGFTRTVNLGIAQAGKADVIILNSDARVTPRWIEGMVAAAGSRARVATVTAMSDRAGAFSAPDIGNENPLPPGVDEEDFARAFRRRSLRLYPEVPTGNGFCMLIRRDALNELGGLDEEAFPRGYGEENDFCMRALRAGWINLIDDATYVFHDRSKSFGDQKNDNLPRGRSVIDERYPEYKMLIREFHTGSSVNMARFRARLALQDCTNGRGVQARALFVLSTRTGGTPQTNADLMRALDDSYECFVLNCDSKTIELSILQDGKPELLWQHRLVDPVEPLRHTSSDYDAIVAHWLGMLDLDVIHIRHLGWHSLNLPVIARRSGARVVMSFHDFYTLCPSLKLIDDNGVFCGGPCTAGTGQCKVQLWKPESIPPLKNGWVKYWRDRMADALAHCHSFVTTSPSARDRILSGLPSLPKDDFHVIPHGRDFGRFDNLHRLPNGGERFRVLVPGNIDDTKGLDLIAEMIDIDALRHCEFHIVGNVASSRLTDKQKERLRMHGPFERKDFAERVREIAPHIGVILSIWDETYCHTLTEMWSVGLPVAVLDFPTLRSRVEESGAGWVLTDRQPKSIYGFLQRVSADRDDLIAKHVAALQWQAAQGEARSCRQMASRYIGVYRGGKVGEELPKIAVTGVPGFDLSKAYASTYIRLWERTRNVAGRPHVFVRSTPAGLIAKMKAGLVDGAIVQRTSLPAVMVEKFVETADETRTPYVFELDDHLAQVAPDKDPSGFYQAYGPFLKELLQNAAAVTVSTPALAREVSHINSKVHVVENRMSARLWAGGRKQGASKGLQLLYFGTETHAEDLDFAIKGIETARRSIPGITLSVVGASERGDLPEWVQRIEVPRESQPYTRFVPWLRSAAEDAVLGIAPLLDTEFNRFQSDLKILEYGALGLPVIASNVESFQTFADSQLAGVSLVPNSPEAWSDAIINRLQEPSALRAAGEELKAWVFEHRRIEDDLARYDQLVSDAISGGEPAQRDDA